MRIKLISILIGSAGIGITSLLFQFFGLNRIAISLSLCLYPLIALITFFYSRRKPDIILE